MFVIVWKELDSESCSLVTRLMSVSRRLRIARGDAGAGWRIL